MLKKFVGIALLAGFIGVLVWGGVNRTLAKTNDFEANYQQDAQRGDGVGNGNGFGSNQASEYEDDCSEDGYGKEESDVDDQLGVSASYQNGNDQGNGNGNTSSNQGEGQDTGQWSGFGHGQGQGANVEPLSEAEIEALNLALDDEYKALATYQAVIEKFGQVEPFVDIAQSEQRHIDALAKQYEKYGIPVPENPWPSNVPEFDSVAEACQAGIEAENVNAELYERLFEMTDNRALLNVFTNLSRASQESHLPAFEDC